MELGWVTLCSLDVRNIVGLRLWDSDEDLESTDSEGAHGHGLLSLLNRTASRLGLIFFLAGVFMTKTSHLLD